jgi:hypothetical protein
MTTQRQLFYATCLWAVICLLFTVMIIYKVGIE